MHLDVHVPRLTWPGGTTAIAPTLRDVAQTAEEIGVRTVSLMDHYFQIAPVGPPEEPMLEGYTTLGFLAACTERVGLRLLVTGVTYRHPGLLAKIVTTLDVLSQGRAELGIGAAWFEEEHVGLGVAFPTLSERFERLGEALEICKQMWSDDDGPYEGKHYQLARTLNSPPSISRPRPRILIGGGGERKTARLVAEHADAWHLFAPDTEVLAHKLDVLRRHCDDVGRDVDEIEVLTGLRASADEPDAVLRQAEAFAALGVDAFTISPVSDDPVGELATGWAPLLPQLAEIGR